jgi:hypothetical protein
MIMHESLASVSQLQELRTEPETYETFYQLYSADELSKHGFYRLMSRVLHTDEAGDRSTHFVVAHAKVALPPIRRNYDDRGVPAHYIPYVAEDMVVASTDGKSIVEYDVTDAFGVYRGFLNNTDQAHNPANEKMFVKFRSANDNILSNAEFNMATGDGIVNLAGRSSGWILSEGESNNIRERLLSAPTIGNLGRTAIAS